MATFDKASEILCIEKLNRSFSRIPTEFLHHFQYTLNPDGKKVYKVPKDEEFPILKSVFAPEGKELVSFPVNDTKIKNLLVRQVDTNILYVEYSEWDDPSGQLHLKVLVFPDFDITHKWIPVHDADVDSVICLRVPDPQGFYRVFIADFHRYVCARIDCRKNLQSRELGQPCLRCLANKRVNLFCNPECCLKSKHKHLDPMPERVLDLPKESPEGAKICVVCAKTAPKMKKCRACLDVLAVNVYYCSAQCAKDDARRHRPLCGAAAK